LTIEADSIPLLRAPQTTTIYMSTNGKLQSTGRTIGLALKGAAMGAANVIPGVSGGTIAFITGIYEELIDSIKSFDLEALQLALKFKVREFIKHTNLKFLIAVGVGVITSIVSLAKLLEYVFINHETLTMAFFFGLIVSSVYLVGKQIGKWNTAAIFMLLLGAGIAVGIAFLKPAQENANPLWIFLCGIVAISSMILPGLSGSYVLLIMGNYLLILNAISNLKFAILIPMSLGCGIGLVAFSHILSYIFKHFRNGTVGLLTGFVAGSLAIIWPWKKTVYLTNEAGEFILKRGKEKIIAGYEWFLPVMDGQFAIAAVLMLIGAVVVVVIGRFDEQEKPAGKAALETRPEASTSDSE
jgi:putative membrane protein